MATQILDTELDVCRKELHFAQRELATERFNLDGIWACPDDEQLAILLTRVKYWRMRYNAAYQIEQYQDWLDKNPEEVREEWAEGEYY